MAYGVFKSGTEFAGNHGSRALDADGVLFGGVCSDRNCSLTYAELAQQSSGDIVGHTVARVLRSSADGVFFSERTIGDRINAGDVVGTVDGTPVTAAIGGILRGLIRHGTRVTCGLKLGDIDPRAKAEYCSTISDKARAIAGSVLEAIMRNLRPW